MAKRIEVTKRYLITTMDPLDSAEEEAQWILGYGAKRDIQNKPAEHGAEGEDIYVEKRVMQRDSGCAIVGTSHILLPSVLPFTPYENYQ